MQCSYFLVAYIVRLCFLFPSQLLIAPEHGGGRGPWIGPLRVLPYHPASRIELWVIGANCYSLDICQSPLLERRTIRLLAPPDYPLCKGRSQSSSPCTGEIHSLLPNSPGSVLQYQNLAPVLLLSPDICVFVLLTGTEQNSAWEASSFNYSSSPRRDKMEHILVLLMKKLRLGEGKWWSKSQGSLEWQRWTRTLQIKTHIL